MTDEDLFFYSLYPVHPLTRSYVGLVTNLCQQSNGPVVAQQSFRFAGDLLAQGGGLEHLHLAAPPEQPVEQVALVAQAEGKQQAVGAGLFVGRGKGAPFAPPPPPPPGQHGPPHAS